MSSCSRNGTVMSITRSTKKNFGTFFLPYTGIPKTEVIEEEKMLALDIVLENYIFTCLHIVLKNDAEKSHHFLGRQQHASIYNKVTKSLRGMIR